MSKIMVTYSIYERIEGDGPAFYCECRENGESRLLFSGPSAFAAEFAAREWAAKNLDTPERRERLAQAAERRRLARLAKKAAEVA